MKKHAFKYISNGRVRFFAEIVTFSLYEPFELILEKLMERIFAIWLVDWIAADSVVDWATVVGFFTFPATSSIKR